VPLLSVRGLTQRFGGLLALDGVSFDLEPEQAIGLVGPNGSGKTTCINTICGLYRPTSGTVDLDGTPITGKPAHVLARLGIGRTFQIPHPFTGMTVRENLLVATTASTPRELADPNEVLERIGLAHLATKEAATLNATQQKLLDLGRALMLRPRVLFVDELGAGLAPSELSAIATLLRQVAADGCALVVVEHLLGFLEQITPSVLVLNAGRTIFAGQLRDALRDPDVERVFLGSSGSHD
jgi:branched-chain amino acid transport system ATP-binding protein